MSETEVTDRMGRSREATIGECERAKGFGTGLTNSFGQVTVDEMDRRRFIQDTVPMEIYKRVIEDWSPPELMSKRTHRTVYHDYKKMPEWLENMDELTKKRVVLRNGHISIDPEILSTQKLGGQAKKHAKKKK